MGREDPGEQDSHSELDVEERCFEVFSGTRGLVLACYSPQNIDRYVSIYRAALRSDRDLVIDLYTAMVADATRRESIPQAKWDRVKVFVPLSQRIKVKDAKAFERVNAVRAARIFPEQLEGERERRSDGCPFRTLSARQGRAGASRSGRRRSSQPDPARAR